MLNGRQARARPRLAQQEARVVEGGFPALIDGGDLVATWVQLEPGPVPERLAGGLDAVDARHLEDALAVDAVHHDEHLPALRGVRAVEVVHGLRLLRQVEGIHGLQLHLERKLIRLQARLQLPVLPHLLRVNFVELLEQVELPPLFGQRDELVADVLDEFFGAVARGVDCRALERAGEERGAEVLRVHVAGRERDEAGQALVLAAEAVEHPRADAGPRETQRAGVHEDGHRVRWGSCSHSHSRRRRGRC